MFPASHACCVLLPLGPSAGTLHVLQGQACAPTTGQRMGRSALQVQGQPSCWGRLTQCSPCRLGVRAGFLLGTSSVALPCDVRVCSGMASGGLRYLASGAVALILEGTPGHR